jgi:hypothetical protein
MLETKEHIAQFLVLQGKSPEELRSICEGMKLSAKGDKADLIDRLIAAENVSPQHDVLIAQAIALRTRGPDGPISTAIETMKQWRKVLFDSGKFKEFGLLNGKGEAYTARLKYLKCSPETLVKIIKNGWVYPQPMQADLINAIIASPAAFRASVVQKPSSKGGNFMMLHVEPIG